MARAAAAHKRGRGGPADASWWTADGAPAMPMVQGAALPPRWGTARLEPPFRATCIVCGGSRFATPAFGHENQRGWNCMTCNRIEDPRFWKVLDTMRM
jgi:hypothetical protein